jgi:hypothetical protein
MDGQRSNYGRVINGQTVLLLAAAICCLCGGIRIVCSTVSNSRIVKKVCSIGRQFKNETEKSRDPFKTMSCTFCDSSLERPCPLQCRQALATGHII